MLGVIQQGSFEFLHLDEPLSIVSRVAEFLAWIYKNKEKKKESVMKLVNINKKYYLSEYSKLAISSNSMV